MPRSRSIRERLSRSGPYRDVTRALDRISVFDRQRGTDQTTNRRLRRQMAGELGPVLAYLDAHPDEEGRIRADVADRNLADGFPWPAFNEGRARDLAVLYCFTPYLDTSALVAARRIYVRGVVTDVVSQQLDDSRRTDPTSPRIAREYVDESRILPGASGHGSWAAIRTFVEGALAEVEALVDQKGPYRTLYTRAMAPHSHFAGAILKLRNPDLVWTAEFSDPLRINASGEIRANDVEDDWLIAELSAGLEAAGYDVPTTRLLFTWAELVAYAFADEVLFTNDHQRRFMLDYCEDRTLADRVAERAVVSHQPTLPRSFYEHSATAYPLEPDVVNIGYFGLFFRTRGLTEVLEAVAGLEPADRARVRLHVFTDNPTPLAEDIEARGLSEVVNARPYIPFLRFLNLTTRFDVLLVNDATTQGIFPLNPYLPSKVSDYRGSGRPIWGVYEPGSVLSSLDTEYASELGDVAGARDVLRAVIADRFGG